MTGSAETPSGGTDDRNVPGLHRTLMRLAPYRWTIAFLSTMGMSGRSTVVAVPYLWLFVFFVTPFIIVFKISFATLQISMPPYSDVFRWGESLLPDIVLDWGNYALLFDDRLYVLSYLGSLEIAAVSTFFTVLVGFPIALGMARAPKQWQPALLMAVILPFWTSFLIRVYAWIGILKKQGLLNFALMNLGVIDQPLEIMNTDTAVYIGIVYSYLPFMVLPIYASLEKMDNALLEAANDLGCPPVKAFWLVTVPLAMPGIIAGCFLVFIPAVGEFVIPDILGGAETLMVGKTLWSEFFNNRDWPLASAMAVILLAVLIVPMLLFQRIQARNAEI